MDAINNILHRAKVHGFIADIPYNFQSHSFVMGTMSSESSASGPGKSRCGGHSVYGNDCEEITHVEHYFSSGYKVQTEMIGGQYSEGDPSELEVAYTLNNEYIGSKDDAVHFAMRGITPQLASPTHKTCSIGKGIDGKWYGWSHRAIFGFPVGHKVEEGSAIFDTNKGPWVIENESDQRKAATMFAASVSSSNLTQADTLSLRSISAKKPNVSPDQLAWYRFKGKVAKAFDDYPVTVRRQENVLYLPSNEVFGIALNEETNTVYVMDTDLEHVWEIPSSKIKLLLKRCAGFGGKVNGEKYTKGNGDIEQNSIKPKPVKKPRKVGAKIPRQANQPKSDNGSFTIDLDSDIDMADIAKEHQGSFSEEVLESVLDDVDLDKPIVDADELDSEIEDFADEDIVLDGGENNDDFTYNDKVKSSRSRKARKRKARQEDFLGDEEDWEAELDRQEETGEIEEDLMQEDEEDLMQETNDGSINVFESGDLEDSKPKQVYAFTVVSHATDTILVGFNDTKDLALDDLEAVTRMHETIGNGGTIYAVPRTNGLYRKFLGRKKQNSLFIEALPQHEAVLKRDATAISPVQIKADLRHQTGSITTPNKVPRSFHPKQILHPNNRVGVYSEMAKLIMDFGYFTKAFVVDGYDKEQTGPVPAGIYNVRTQKQQPVPKKVISETGTPTKIARDLKTVPYLELLGTFDSHKVAIEGRAAISRIRKAYGNTVAGYVTYNVEKQLPALRIYLRPFKVTTPEGKAAYKASNEMYRDLKSKKLKPHTSTAEIPYVGLGIVIGYNIMEGTITAKSMQKDQGKMRVHDSKDGHVPSGTLPSHIKQDPNNSQYYTFPYNMEARNRRG